MKTTRRLPAFAILLLIFAQTSFAQPSGTDDPVRYNQIITQSLGKIVQANVDYIMFSVHSTDKSKVNSKRQKVMKLIESEISTLSTSLPFRKRTTLRDESVKVMKLYLATYKNELLNAMNLKADSERSVEDMEAYLKAQDGAEAKLQEATQLFNKAQYRFASDYKLALVDAEGDLFNTVELISKVNKYSRKVFLVFFRISKANELFMAALNEQDAVKMENNRVDLANACKLGKYQLQTIGPFDGDSEYNETVKKLINFTGDLADNKYKSLVEIMDKSGPMTQEDVDEYNSVINIYNEKYIPLINDFNDAGNNFMKRNIPSGS